MEVPKIIALLVNDLLSPLALQVHPLIMTPVSMLFEMPYSNLTVPLRRSIHCETLRVTGNQTLNPKSPNP